jgi:hypothetical protein
MKLSRGGGGVRTRTLRPSSGRLYRRQRRVRTYVCWTTPPSVRKIDIGRVASADVTCVRSGTRAPAALPRTYRTWEGLEFPTFRTAPSARLELATSTFVASRSIHLSYEGLCCAALRGLDGSRTRTLRIDSPVRYRCATRP